MDNPMLPCDGDDCPRKLQCRRYLERDEKFTVLAADADGCEIFEPAQVGGQSVVSLSPGI